MNLRDFYDDWYKNGYMDEWPVSKKIRVIDLVAGLQLPEKGTALDFGCGNGVFTDVLKKALPGWEIYGSDLSLVAVENAAKRFPECHFLEYTKESFSELSFDLVFSHHVLEHVDAPTEIASLISGLTKPSGSMFHILPCGNAGSLEQKISAWSKDGIRKDKGNTFFFEEDMHLQRFTSAGLAELFAPHGFEIKKELFANQYYGALLWISGMPKQFIQRLANYKNGSGAGAFIKLFYYHILLIFLYYLFRPYHLYKQQKISGIKKIAYNLSAWLHAGLQRLADKEWKKNKAKKNGSEMYIFFKK